MNTLSDPTDACIEDDPSVIPSHSAEPQPRWIQAAILLVASSLTVLVASVLGPSMGTMQAHFAGVPGADYLVPLTVTAPMLVMAFLCIFAGAISDRFGRKRLLVAATALYAVVGTAPLWLDSLTAIIASRVLLGVAEAFIIAISTTMIGDYFSGPRREKLMALQTTTSAASAVAFNLIGGMIGEFGWRAPFTVYCISLILAPLMMIYLWEPRHTAIKAGATIANDPALAPATEAKLNRGLLLLICVLAFLTGLAFLIVPVHLAYLMEALGVQSPSTIGMAAALNSASLMVGTLVFGWIIAPRWPVGMQLAFSAAVPALGFLLMGTATTATLLTAAAMINGFGCGTLFPTIVTWNMRILPLARRGFGTGAYQSFLFTGMFINPIVVVYLGGVLGSRANVMTAIGAVMALLAMLAAIIALRLRTSGTNLPKLPKAATF